MLTHSQSWPARKSPPPLWGRVREGGRAELSESSQQSATISKVCATPLPGPPPQGGRGFKSDAVGDRATKSARPGRRG
jgi:hypothetical protein